MGGRTTDVSPPFRQYRGPHPVVSPVTVEKSCDTRRVRTGLRREVSPVVPQGCVGVGAGRPAMSGGGPGGTLICVTGVCGRRRGTTCHVRSGPGGTLIYTSCSWVTSSTQDSVSRCGGLSTESRGNCLFPPLLREGKWARYSRLGVGHGDGTHERPISR